jgi:hypothetical protein
MVVDATLSPTAIVDRIVSVLSANTPRSVDFA